VRKPVKNRSELERRLDRLDARLKALEKVEAATAARGAATAAQGRKTMIDLKNLADEVAQDETVIGSTETLLEKLTEEIAEISAASNDEATQAALDGYVARLNAARTALAQAVVEHTPGAEHA
jgi:chromosome segregation ATPase